MKHGIKSIILAATAAIVFSFAAPEPQAQQAQVSFGFTVGAAPVCPYGYYDYSPYNCSPYGYYGPEWFNGGVFIGAGPWFHGPRGFYGHVNHAYDPHYGYHGAFPGNGPYHAPPDNFHSFHGNATRDGMGHEGRPGAR